MTDSKTPEQRMKKATMDEKTCQRFCQLLGKKSIPQSVVDEWGQFKVYADRLGVGTMQMPAYVMMFIAQKAGACPHIPVKVEVNGDMEAEVETEPIVTTVLTIAGPGEDTLAMKPPKKPYTGKRRGRPPVFPDEERDVNIAETTTETTVETTLAFDLSLEPKKKGRPKGSKNKKKGGPPKGNPRKPVEVKEPELVEVDG